MKQYSFYSVDLLIDGVPVDGFSDGNNIISAGYNSQQQGHVIGARGEMVVTTTRNRSGVILFTLLQTSDWNNILTERTLLNVNTGTSGNNALFTPIQAMINDKMGNTLVTGVNGYSPTVPPIVRGTNVNVVNWSMFFEEMVFSQGTYPNAGI